MSPRSPLTGEKKDESSNLSMPLRNRGCPLEKGGSEKKDHGG